MSPEQVTRRLDRLIGDIRQKYHAPVIGKPKNSEAAGDVLLVAHGHILRAFEHHELAEPAILLGGGFMVDVVEESERLGKEEGEQEKK